MRVKKSFLNAVSNSLILIIRSVLLFVVRIVFVKTLGKMYLGVDSLFTNVLLVLSIADSGISTAINFSLYKPLADKNYKKLSSLMTFYKKAYKTLGLIVLGVGLLFIPFLQFVIHEHIDHIYLYYLIYLATVVIPYFISYKDSLLTADQNLYQSSIIVGSTFIIMYLLRIAFLIYLPNFFIFAIIQLVMIIIQRILINRYITKKYKQVNFNEKESITKKEKKTIFKNVKAVFLNKVGYFLVAGTDNIIISAIPGLGLGVVAIYTNYYSVVGTVDNVILKGLSGITSSFGDLAVSESKEIQEDVFNILAFLTFILVGLFTIGFMFLLTPLIQICFGSGFKVSIMVLLAICLNFYFSGNLKSLDVIKEATGVYHQDRYVNMLQALINVILSITLGIKFGLFGVVLATLISCIVLPLWNRPYIAYKYIFKKKLYKYYLRQFMYLLSLVLIFIVTHIILKYIVIDNAIISFIVKAVIISIIYFIGISIIYFKTKEYKYLYTTIKKKIKKA